MPDYDKLLPDIESSVEAKPGMYLFKVPGTNASAYISLDLIDRLQQDVMRGFGAVPKRGAEVGGILLGSANGTDRLIVELEDYEMVTIEYKRGPSYQLSPADLVLFEETLERRRNAPADGLKPVGFFRSHTRDSVGLGPDDTELLDRLFPDEKSVVLLIKPYATRVGKASVLIRENGAFPSGEPVLEFPFRRKDVAPGDNTPPTRSRDVERGTPHPVAPGPGGFAPGPRAESIDPGADLSLVRHREHREQGLGRPQIPQEGYADFTESESGPDPGKTKERTGWVWVPLSFIFLLLGVLLGFQAALTLRPQAAAGPSDPFNLRLNVSKEGDNLNVRWDRQGLAVRTAGRGVLVIVDGKYKKQVELDSNQLQTGSVVYQHNSTEVQFRFEVYPRERAMIVETINWKE